MNVKTPYTYVIAGKTLGILYDADAKIVGTVQASQAPDIVLACNAHDALIEIVGEFIHRLDTRARPYLAGDPVVVAALIAAARAAIATAEE